MHSGGRAFAIRATRWLNTGAAAGMAMAEPLDARGATCSRVASFTAPTTLQQGARSSAVPLSSPLLAQQASGCAEAHQSAARAGRAVEPTRTLTAKAAATRRIGCILLGSPFRDTVWSMMSTPGVHARLYPQARIAPPMDVPPSPGSSLRRAAELVRGAPPHRR